MHVLATRFGSDEFGGFKTRRTGSLLARNLFEDKLRVPCEDTVPAEVAKGSVLLYVGSVYHGGGANRSAERRMGVNIGYTLSWLRQEENQYLSCPPDVARTFPVELAKPIGYQRGAYALGYFGDTQDPIEALHGAGSAPHGFAVPDPVG